MNLIGRFLRWQEHREIHQMFKKAGRYTGESIALIERTNPTLAQLVYLKTHTIMREPLTDDTDWPEMRDRLEREIDVVQEALAQEFKRLGYGNLADQ